MDKNLIVMKNTKSYFKTVRNNFFFVYFFVLLCIKKLLLVFVDKKMLYLSMLYLVDNAWCYIQTQKSRYRLKKCKKRKKQKRSAWCILKTKNAFKNTIMAPTPYLSFIDHWCCSHATRCCMQT